jgi:hypothetical protein
MLRLSHINVWNDMHDIVANNTLGHARLALIDLRSFVNLTLVAIISNIESSIISNIERAIAIPSASRVIRVDTYENK